jgi:hypothetical protein
MDLLSLAVKIGAEFLYHDDKFIIEFLICGYLINYTVRLGQGGGE